MDWRTPINQILFGLTYTRELTDEVVDWNADSAIRYQSLGRGPAVYYQAIQDALASGEHLDNFDQVPQFSQQELSEFLRALASRLDSLRPWPEPRFRPADDPAPWASLLQSAKIAELDVSMLELTPLLRRPFRPTGEGQDGKYALVLALQTGEIVALLGSQARGEKVALLSQESDDPDTVIGHFVEATGIAPSKVVRV